MLKWHLYRRVRAACQLEVLSHSLLNVDWRGFTTWKLHVVRLWPKLEYRLAAVSCACIPECLSRVYAHYPDASLHALIALVSQQA
jgi:hypothetical protein